MRRFDCSCTLLVIVLSICSQSLAAGQEDAGSYRRIEIAEGWKIKSIAPRKSLDSAFLAETERPDESNGWLAAATMPAMVHDILLEDGRIETPWLPGAAEKCQWVAQQDWVYAVDFEVADPRAESLLRFEGLDTIVDVYLNSRLIASHSNMYLPLTVDASGQLRKSNTLVLHFHSVYEQSGNKRSRIRNVSGDPNRRVRRPSQNYPLQSRHFRAASSPTQPPQSGTSTR